MTREQFQKKISSMPRDELINYLLKLFDNSKAFREALRASEMTEADEIKLLQSSMKKLEEIFYPTDIMRQGFSLDKALNVLSDFSRKCENQAKIAELNLCFAVQATDFTQTYGDVNEEFYSELENAFLAALSYAQYDKAFFMKQKDSFEYVVDESMNYGWGVYDTIGGELSSVAEMFEAEDDNTQL